METKICVLAEYFYPDNTGGSGTILSKLLRELQDSYPDIKIDVVTSNNLFRGEAGALSARENWDGIRIRRLSAPQPRKNSVKRRLAANLTFTYSVLGHLLKSRERYDVVLVLTAPPTLPLAAKLYGKLTGTPYVYLVYDLFLDMAVNMGLIRPRSRAVGTLRKIQKSWLHHATSTIVLGRCMLEHVVREYDLPRKKLCVVPIPSNTEAIVPLHRNTQFRASNNLNGFVVLYAGNFARYQDFDTLLDAAALLVARDDITFVFVGNGTRREHIANRIDKENLRNVRLLPFVPEKALGDMLASADVSLVTLDRGVAGLAVPSKFYNIMASGRPTIAILDPVSEVAQVIAEAECGVRVDPEDSHGLARAIHELADCPEKLQRMGQNARRISEDKYSVKQIGGSFYDLLREAAGHSSKDSKDEKRGIVARERPRQLVAQSSPDVEGG